MKKAICLFICTVLLFCSAAAEQTVVLPESMYALEVPDDMEYSAPEAEDNGVHAYISDTLEMDYLSYSKEEAAVLGLSGSMQENAKKIAAGGAEAEVYEVNGIEMLVYRITDQTDGAPGIGYAFADGDRIIEVIFWYATQEAADRTKTIMETIHVNNS